MKGVFLHVLADALGSVVVIISALIIWLTDWEYRMYVDPTLSICLVGLIMWTTWPLRKLSYLITWRKRTFYSFSFFITYCMVTQSKSQR